MATSQTGLGESPVKARFVVQGRRRRRDGDGVEVSRHSE